MCASQSQQDEYIVLWPQTPGTRKLLPGAHAARHPRLLSTQLLSHQLCFLCSGMRLDQQVCESRARGRKATFVWLNEGGRPECLCPCTHHTPWQSSRLPELARTSSFSYVGSEPAHSHSLPPSHFLCNSIFQIIIFKKKFLCSVTRLGGSQVPPFPSGSSGTPPHPAPRIW